MRSRSGLGNQLRGKPNDGGSSVAMHHKTKLLIGLAAAVCAIGSTFGEPRADPTRPHDAFDSSYATYDWSATPKSPAYDATIGQEQLGTSAAATIVGTGAITVMNHNELSAHVSNGPGISGDFGAAAVSTGNATLGGYQQQNASGSFNNVVNTGFGNIIQQSNTVTMIFLPEGSGGVAGNPLSLTRKPR